MLECICGAEEQSANHIIFDCNILRPPNCLEDLRSPNFNNTKWLEDLVVLFEPLLTRKKKPIGIHRGKAGICPPGNLDQELLKRFVNVHLQ